MTRVGIDHIRCDGGTQMRVKIDQETVESYADDMTRAGRDQFPPVTVYYDGETYWMADGFHRLAAHRLIGASEIDCEVVAGTRNDAIWFAIGTNHKQGLRRSNVDKQVAVRAALRHPNAVNMSDRSIAELVGVDHVTITKYRNYVVNSTTSANQESAPTVKRVGVDGIKRPSTRRSMTAAKHELARRSGKSKTGAKRNNGNNSTSADKHAASRTVAVKCEHCQGKGYVDVQVSESD